MTNFIKLCYVADNAKQNIFTIKDRNSETNKISKTYSLFEYERMLQKDTVHDIND